MKQIKLDSKKNDARRKVLKGIVSSGGIAGAATISSWSKPVVESVLLPAHAATTEILNEQPTLRTFALAGTSLVSLIRPDSTLLRQRGDVESKSILDRFIPSVQAQGFSAGSLFEAVLFETALGVFTLQVLGSEVSSEDCILYFFLSASGLTEGVSGTGDYEDCLGAFQPGIMVTVSSATESNATVTIEGDLLGVMPIVASAPALTAMDCPCISNLE